MALSTALKQIAFILIAYSISPLSFAQNGSAGKQAVRSPRAPAQPAIKGYFQSVSPGPNRTFPAFGWACKIGSEEKLRIRLLGLAGGGQWRTLKETTADRASEVGVQHECQIDNAARDDGRGFRFVLTLKREDLDNILDLQIVALTNGQTVDISKVPNWNVVIMGK